ncbi:hypothetical protein CEXT_198021 [Caerostris extrusa]|uniref:Uncharacterized protein n=1 Tax=Caerostris extrusa TaxID=172846 RepID=A0AAV4QC48_CAEEX|nr:hypothetical protein CEXT_198021 [Caerostris extrusa]
MEIKRIISYSALKSLPAVNKLSLGIKLYSSPDHFKATFPKRREHRSLWPNEPSRNPRDLEVEGVYNRIYMSVRFLRLRFSADLIAGSLI